MQKSPPSIRITNTNNKKQGMDVYFPVFQCLRQSSQQNNPPQSVSRQKNKSDTAKLRCLSDQKAITGVQSACYPKKSNRSQRSKINSFKGTLSKFYAASLSDDEPQKRTKSTVKPYQASVFISHLQKQIISKTQSKLHKKIKKEEVNFKKVDFVELYCVKNKLITGTAPTPDHHQPAKKYYDTHDFSDNYIVSKGKMRLNDVSEQSNSQVSESSQSNAPSINNITPISNIELLSLTKKKSKESQFFYYLQHRKSQCLIWEESLNYPNRLFSLVMWSIKLEEEKKTVSFGPNQATFNKIIQPCLKRNKKKVSIIFKNQDEVFHFDFSIERRDRLDKRRSVHYRDKMIAACENASEEEFRKYLARFLRQCVRLKNFCSGRCLTMGESVNFTNNIASVQKQIYMNEGNQLMESALFAKFPSSSTLRSRIIFRMFITMKNKYFLFEIEKHKDENTSARILYEFNPLGALPTGKKFYFHDSIANDQKWFFRESAFKSLTKYSFQIQNWIARNLGRVIYGLTDEDFTNQIVINQENEEEKQIKKPQAFDFDEFEATFEGFSYQIEDINLKNSMKQNSRIRRDSKRKRKETQMKQLNDLVQTMLPSKEESESQRQISGKTPKNSNFFKIRSSFDYGVLKKKKKFLKSYDDSFYTIDMKNFMVSGMRNGKSVYFRIDNQEVRERLLILNLPFHLDEKLRRKFQAYVLDKIQFNQQAQSYSFGLMFINKMRLFKCLQKDGQNFLFQIYCCSSKKTDRFILNCDSRHHSFNFDRDSVRDKISKQLRKNLSLTYYRYQFKRPFYNIVYKKVQKVCAGRFLITTIAEATQMRYFFIRIYVSWMQQSYISELKENSFASVKEAANLYLEYLCKSNFREEIMRAKQRVDRKNRELYCKLVSINNIKDSKICLPDVKARRANRLIRQKSKNKTFANMGVFSSLKIWVEVYQGLHKGFQGRFFLISVMKNEKGTARVSIYQQKKILKYSFELPLEIFIERMLSQLKQRDYENRNIKKIVQPLIDLVVSESATFTDALLKKLKILLLNQQKENKKQICFRFLLRNNLGQLLRESGRLCYYDCYSGILKQFESKNYFIEPGRWMESTNRRFLKRVLKTL